VPREETTRSEHLGGLKAYLSQYHCSTLRTLSPSDMCTSLSPGFYLKDKRSFDRWSDSIKYFKQQFKGECIFSIFDKEPLLNSSVMRSSSLKTSVIR